MKRQVLAAAPPRPAARRRRIGRTGIAIGVVALLGLGAASGAVALGWCPRPSPPRRLRHRPRHTAPDHVDRTVLRRGDPVVPPDPVVEPDPTRAAYAADDATTWTISGSEMGPVAVGGQTAAETDDLDDAASVPCRAPGARPRACGVVRTGWRCRSSPTTRGPSRASSSPAGRHGRPRSGTRATTARGIGVGATLDELQAAYPDLRNDSPGFEDSGRCGRRTLPKVPSASRSVLGRTSRRSGSGPTRTSRPRSATCDGLTHGRADHRGTAPHRTRRTDGPSPQVGTGRHPSCGTHRCLQAVCQAGRTPRPGAAGCMG